MRTIAWGRVPQHRRGGRRSGARRGLAMAAGLAVVATSVTGAGAAGGAAGNAPPPANRFRITVLSGEPDQVSGGDALVQVEVPRSTAARDVTITLDGADVTDAFEEAGRDELVGLVEGLDLGENTLRVSAERRRGNGGPRPAELTLVNHPIGGPIFSGPQQQPFVCTTARARFDGRSLLGQPLVDNQEAIGIPVA